MTSHHAIVPRLITQSENKTLTEALFICVGLALLVALGKISFHLSFTPVPITGQTFGVTLIALLWGRSRAFLITGTYLSLGALGLPVFAAGTMLLIGPTAGYLIGMLLASATIGFFADLGWTKSFLKAFGASLIGSLLIFSLGMAGLYLYVGKSSLLMMGVLPFLPGDILKDALASLISLSLQKHKA